MIDYLRGVFEDFSAVITGRSTSLAANHMFQAMPEDDQTLLDEEGATAFHHMVAQLQYFTSSASKAIKMAISFPCTQVRILYDDDSGNLVRVFIDIRGTLHFPLILRANSLSVIKWWVDAYFSAHSD